jgi:hypothetical protein
MAESKNPASEADGSDAESSPEPSEVAASTESGAGAAEVDAEGRYFDGTEDPIERERNEARSVETQSTTFIRPPGI